MKRIYKYQITVKDINNEYILLPTDATILSIINQKENIVLYYLTDPKQEEMRKREFILRGTGVDIEQELLDRVTYLNYKFFTVPLFNGDLVWHIWVKP